MEIWKNVIEFEDYYSVSNTGKVFSKRKNKVLSYGDNGSGYLFIHLRKKGLNKRMYVHRLVAELFLKNTENKPQVNHKDCNKSNNNISNLEWCTRSENMAHASVNSRMYTSEFQKTQTSLSNRGSKSHLSKLIEIDVVKIKKILINKETTQKKIAFIFNTTRANISAIHRGKSWKHIVI